MSNTPDPTSSKRAGRVSRIPLLVVLLVLVLVAMVGVVLSNHTRDDRSASTTTSTSTTVTTVSSLAGVATPSPGSSIVGTTAPSTTTPSTTATPVGGQDCTADSLRSAIKASGQVDASIVEQFTITSFKCVDPYARACVSAPSADSATAYFVRSGGVWRMLVLGTSVDPTGAGVPEPIVSQLEA